MLKFDDLAAAGKARPAPAVPPKPEDYCTIMYTSGTTGAFVCVGGFFCVAGWLIERA